MDTTHKYNDITYNIKFNTDDIVICVININCSAYLTHGKEYKVIKAFESYNEANINIIDDKFSINSFQSKRFMLKTDFVAISRLNKIKKIKSRIIC